MVINLETAVEFLKTRDNFLILTHSHPDGDTLGSAFALKYALEALGKSANVRCNDTVAKKFDYLGRVCEDECAFDTTVQSVCLPKEHCLMRMLRRHAK